MYIIVLLKFDFKEFFDFNLLRYSLLKGSVRIVGGYSREVLFFFILNRVVKFFSVDGIMKVGE